MKKVLLTIAALALVILVAGCATIPMESNLGKPVSMTNTEGTEVRTFASTNKAIWLFWGTVEISLPTVDGVVAPHVADHAGIRNLKITTQYDFIDFLVTSITDGILTMRTVTIEGEVYD